MTYDDFVKPSHILRLDEIHAVINTLEPVMSNTHNLEDGDDIANDILLLSSLIGNLNMANASAKYWFGHYNGLVLDKILDDNKGLKTSDKLTSSTIIVLKAESELKDLKYLVDVTSSLIFGVQNLIANLKFVLARMDVDRKNAC
jgi:hypothetical protein